MLKGCVSLIFLCLLCIGPHRALAQPQAAENVSADDLNNTSELIVVMKKESGEPGALSFRKPMPAVKSSRRLFKPQKRKVLGLLASSSTPHKKSATSEELDRTFVVELESGKMSAEELMKQWAAHGDVERVQPNFRYHTQAIPNDPYYSSNTLFQGTHDDVYALKSDKIDAAGAWNTASGSGAVVAVIDTGIDLTHPDLVSNLWINQDEIPGNEIDDDGNGLVDDVHGYNFDRGSRFPPDDDSGHGTHVAGIVAATGNNLEGSLGVAYDARLMSIKVLNAFGSGTTSAITSGIRYAVANGASVINLSLGSGSRSTQDTTYETAIREAVESGVIVVVAAGNAKDHAQYYSPARYPEVVTVAATDHNDRKASFSNYGHSIDISAPGTKILSTYPEDLFSSYTGITVTQTSTSQSFQGKYVNGSTRIESTQLSGEVVYIGRGDDQSIASADLNGKIALAKRNRGRHIAPTSVALKVLNAGAIGIIFINDQSQTFTGDPSAYTFLPMISLSQEDGENLVENVQAGLVQVQINVDESIGAYDVKSGTSMATPHVAGAVALLRSAFPSATTTEILQRLFASADNIEQKNPGYESMLGVGRLNIAKALTVSVEPLPKLFRYDERLREDGAYEIIFTLKNYGTLASNVSAKVRAISAGITVSNANFSVGSLEPLALASNESSPVLLHYDGRNHASDIVQLEVDIFLNGQFFRTEKSFFLRTYFHERAEAAGIYSSSTFGDWRFNDLIFTDIDSDNATDIISVQAGKATPFINNGNRTFTFLETDSGLPTSTSAFSTVYGGHAIDFDNDGNKEIVMSTGGGMYFYQYVSDDFVRTQISDVAYEGSTSFYFDWDRDGLIDILASSRTDNNTLAIKLYRNQGGLQFEDVTSGAGLQGLELYLQRAAMTDFDLDGDLDLFFQWRAFENIDGVFTEITDQSGLPVYDAFEFTGNSALRTPNYTRAGDIDNDGDFDLIFIDFWINSLYDVRNVQIFRNNGDKTFTDVSVEYDLDGVLGYYDEYSALIDYNNDGFLDLALTTGILAGGVRGFSFSDAILENADGKFFADAATVTGLKGALEASVGTVSQSYADYDADGDIDIMTNDFYKGALFFENTVSGNSKNNFLSLQLIGQSSSPRDAYGARVVVKTSSQKTITREAGNAPFVVSNPVHIGLGEGQAVKSVEIHWPSGKLQVLSTSVLINESTTILETACSVNHIDCNGMCKTRNDSISVESQCNAINLENPGGGDPGESPTTPTPQQPDPEDHSLNLSELIKQTLQSLSVLKGKLPATQEALGLVKQAFSSIEEFLSTGSPSKKFIKLARKAKKRLQQNIKLQEKILSGKKRGRKKLIKSHRKVQKSLLQLQKRL